MNLIKIHRILFGSCLFFSLSHGPAFSQKSCSFSIFNNATKLPFSSFAATWNQPWHPGICGGYEFRWKEGSHWFQSVKAGFYYHQFAQAGIQLYTDFGYRKDLFKGLYWEAALSGGYLHAIPLTEQARLNSNGDYEIRNGIGRPQAMVGINPGLGYRFQAGGKDLALFMNYQIWLQLPFVPGYVPLLPNGSVHFGGRIFLNPKTSSK